MISIGFLKKFINFQRKNDKEGFLISDRFYLGRSKARFDRKSHILEFSSINPLFFLYRDSSNKDPHLSKEKISRFL